VDTRKQGNEILDRFEFRSAAAAGRDLVCLVVASLLACLPEYAGLEASGRASLWILLLAAGLWFSEAIPAFATALLVIGLQILLLGDLAGGGDRWEIFTDPWASPPMWLFFGGLVLARAAERTGLAAWIARYALTLTGGQGPRVLLAAAAVTMTFSMFISNTATAALMVAVLGPLAATGGASREARAALLIGVAFAANLGGMGTIIGTPPNAIAAGLLAAVQPVSFLDWMMLGVPPALLLAAGTIGTLMVGRLRGQRFSTPATGEGTAVAVNAVAVAGARAAVPLWQRAAVMVVFSLTVLLWLSEGWHGLPTAVVSFVPIVALSTIGVIRREDIRALPWDILILLAGGLSLGVGVAESGLAGWLARQVAALALTPWLLAIGLCYLTSMLSNLMSNTAAANLILPVAIAIALEVGGPLLAAQFAVPIALAASSAMCLPISTPPNAIVHATGEIGGRDLLRGGLLVGLLAPPVDVAWCFPMLDWLKAGG